MTGAVTDKQVTTVEIKMQWRMGTSKNTMGLVSLGQSEWQCVIIVTICNLVLLFYAIHYTLQLKTLPSMHTRAMVRIQRQGVTKGLLQIY